MSTYTVRISYVDAFGRQGSKEYVTADLVNEAEALSAAAALSDDFAGISGAEVLSYIVSQRVVYSDTVTAGANRDEGVTLVLRKANNFKDILRVPAPIAGIINSDGTVDTSDAAVTAFVSNFFTTGDFTFSDGEQADALLSGRLDL